jgi:hypothetical protein
MTSKPIGAPKCIFCSHWEPPPINDEQYITQSGKCRRYAPMPNSETISTSWSLTHHQDWCGDYEKLNYDACVVRKSLMKKFYLKNEEK